MSLEGLCTCKLLLSCQSMYCTTSALNVCWSLVLKNKTSNSWIEFFLQAAANLSKFVLAKLPLSSSSKKSCFSGGRKSFLNWISSNSWIEVFLQAAANLSKFVLAKLPLSSSLKKSCFSGGGKSFLPALVTPTLVVAHVKRCYPCFRIKQRLISCQSACLLLFCFLTFLHLLSCHSHSKAPAILPFLFCSSAKAQHLMLLQMVNLCQI